MKLNIKIILDRTSSLKDFYRGTYYYGKISVPLPSRLDNYIYHSNIMVHWFNDLSNTKKNEFLWNEGIVRFVKKWQRKEIDFKKFYTEVLPKVTYPSLTSPPDIYRIVPIEYVLHIFPIVDSYNNGGNCKWRSPLSILNKSLEYVLETLTDLKIYPGGFIGRKLELGNTEILWQEFNTDVDLGEGGEELVGYWRRILEGPVIDTTRQVIQLNSSDDVDSFEYFFLQKLKFAYMIYKVFPDYFSKIYPSA